MTTRASAEPTSRAPGTAGRLGRWSGAGLLAGLVSVAVTTTAAAQPSPADVRSRLGADGWPAGHARFAGVDGSTALRALGLERGTIDARTVERGGVLLRLRRNGRLAWLVRVAVASDIEGARAALLRWLQPVQGELVRADAQIAPADVVLVDAGGGGARAGFLAGNVAVWVAGAEAGASGALEVARAFSASLVSGAYSPPAARLLERASGADLLPSVVVAAAPDAEVSLTVEGGHVASAEQRTYRLVVSDPRMGARVHVVVVDALLRSVGIAAVIGRQPPGRRAGDP